MRRPLLKPGFSLIEILLVLCVVSALVLLALPAFTPLLASAKLNAGGHHLADRLNLARQTAVARNAQVEFRLYKLPNDDGASSAGPVSYRAFQAFVISSDGTSTNAVYPPTFLPNGIACLTASGLSSLLSDAASNPPIHVTGSGAQSGLGGRVSGAFSYIAFHFNSDGSTDLSPTQSWFVTVASSRAPLKENGAPANFITILLNPLNGRTRLLQP